MKKILVPTDFSDCSHAAFEQALGMAKELGLEIELLHVFLLPSLGGAGDVLIAMPDQPYQTALAFLQKEAEETIQRFVEGFDIGAVRVATRVESGRAEEAILAAAREGGFDMIVMGTHGRRGFSHVLLGSVAERVVRLAPCPVLTVKAERAARKRAS